MNYKLLKELMKQSETECGFNTEKFAELIVRECMDIAHNVGNISEPDDWALDRCYEIEQRIQDRFGVEE
jgi:hypothetical protein